MIQWRESFCVPSQLAIPLSFLNLNFKFMANNNNLNRNCCSRDPKLKTQGIISCCYTSPNFNLNTDTVALRDKTFYHIARSKQEKKIEDFQNDSHFWELFSQSKSLTSFSLLGRGMRHHSVCYVERREISGTKEKVWEREGERRKQRSRFTGQLMGNLRSHRYKWSGPGCRTSQRWRWGRGDPQSTGKWGGWLLLEERRCCTLGGEGRRSGWGQTRKGKEEGFMNKGCFTTSDQAAAIYWNHSSEDGPCWIDMNVLLSGRVGSGRGELGRARQKVWRRGVDCF